MSQTEIALHDILGDKVGVYVLYAAIGLALLFLGIVAYDHFRGRRRRKHNHRHLPPAPPLRRRLLRPFTVARETFHLLRSAAQRNARRKERDQKIARQMRRYTK